MSCEVSGITHSLSSKLSRQPHGYQKVT